MWYSYLMIKALIRWAREFRANHRAFGFIADDPSPDYSRADRADGLGREL